MSSTPPTSPAMLTYTACVLFLAYFIGPGVASSGCPATCACSRATSDSDPASVEQHVDCSGKQLDSLEDILDQLGSNTTVLDLRHNRITTIRSNAFAGHPRLSTILLDDNNIADVQPFAFKGLFFLRTISLKRNQLSIIAGNAFSDISGKEDSCGAVTSGATDSKRCVIDLTENDLTNITRHAFAWMKRLQVSVGHGKDHLNIDAYAFYGARWIAKFTVSSVPSLEIKPRVFTNTANLDSIEISDTLMSKVDGFVFEGLKNVSKITFRNVRFKDIGQYAFSGIGYLRVISNGKTVAGKNNTKTSEVDEMHKRGGGEFRFHYCHLDHIPTDCFRDTNLASISISSSKIGRVESHAFRGLMRLRFLILSDNHIGSLSADSLGSMRGLDQLCLDRNSVSVLPSGVFRDTSEVKLLRIWVGRQSFTLNSDAFSGLMNVGDLVLQGSGSPLTVSEGAFRNLIAVNNLTVTDFDMPTMKRLSFVGMAKIKNLDIKHCKVERIENQAFGDIYSHQGAVESFSMDAGNKLICDCSSVAILREFDQAFSSHVERCRSSTEPGRTFVADVDSLVELYCSHARRNFTNLHLILILSCICLSFVNRYIVFWSS